MIWAYYLRGILHASKTAVQKRCERWQNCIFIEIRLRLLFTRNLHNLQNKSEESIHDRHKWNRFGSTATNKNAIGSAEAMRTQTDLHCYQNSFETMIYEEFWIICKIIVSNNFLTGTRYSAATEFSRGGWMHFLRWSCGMRRATGERYERGLKD